MYAVRYFAHQLADRGESLPSASHDTIARLLTERLGRLRERTVRHDLHALRAYYHFLIETSGRRDDPTAGLHIKLPRLQPRRPFTTDELRALLAACRSSRDRAIVLVLLATGVRVSELLGMTAEDIDWEGGTVLVQGKGHKERWVGLGQTAGAALRSQLDGRTGVVWLTHDGGPVKRARVKDMLRCLSARSGVAHVYAHRFRITFANRFLEAGGDLGALQVLMGHSQIGQTAYYAGFTAASRALEQQRRFNAADAL